MCQSLFSCLVELVSVRKRDSRRLVVLMAQFHTSSSLPRKCKTSISSTPNHLTNSSTRKKQANHLRIAKVASITEMIFFHVNQITQVTHGSQTCKALRTIKLN